MTAEKMTASNGKAVPKRTRKTAVKRRTRKKTKAAARKPATKPARKPSQTPRAPKPEEVKVAALELREIRKTVDKFKKELRLADDSVADPYLRERLFTDLALNFFYGGEQDSEAFLKEAREQKKVIGKAAGSSANKKVAEAKKRNPGKDLEQIYGPGVVVVESVEHD